MSLTPESVAQRLQQIDERLQACERRTSDPPLQAYSVRSTATFDLIRHSPIFTTGPSLDVTFPPSGQVLCILACTYTCHVPGTLTDKLAGYINGQYTVDGAAIGSGFSRLWTISGLRRVTGTPGATFTLATSWSFYQGITAGDTIRLLDRELTVLPIPEASS